MKKVVMMTVMMIVMTATLTQAQGDVIFQSRQLTWDHDAVELVEQFNMYCQIDTSGVIIGAGTLVGSIPAPDVVWTLNLGLGNWFCVVTAAVPTTSFESGPSNEWEGTVVSMTPGNLRLVPVASLRSDPLWLMEQIALAIMLGD